jgi:hypothetical protein
MKIYLFEIYICIFKGLNLLNLYIIGLNLKLKELRVEEKKG